MDLPELGSRYRVERILAAGDPRPCTWPRTRGTTATSRSRSCIPRSRPRSAASGSCREIQVVASLAHPHIVPLHDSGAAGDLLYYVMPYVDGETAARPLRREGSLAPDEAVRITREIALGSSTRTVAGSCIAT